MWQAVDLTTGTILEDLPNIVVQGALRHTLGQYESATVALPVSNDAAAGKNWLQATKPGGAALIYCGRDADRTPMWGGMVVKRQRTWHATVVLTLATLEAYLDRRRVRTTTYTNFDQNTIATSLVNTYVKAGIGVLPGLTALTTAVVGSAGVTRTRAYLQTDWKSVYSTLQELMQVQGGPEWSIEWKRTDSQHITPVFQVGTRIGAAYTWPSPRTTFEIPGTLVDGMWEESFASGDGANVETAYSSGEGTSTPLSADQVAGFANNRPVFEEWWEPSTSITDIATLTAHAKQALVDKVNGAAALTLTADWKSAPQLGVEWAIGDDVGYVLSGEAFPGGLAGVSRCIGFEIVPNKTVAPIVAVPALTS